MLRHLLNIGIALIIGFVAAAPTEDIFSQMVFNDTSNFTMPTASYSGYLDVTETKSLHYIFVESKNDPTTDPVVIWFNGGPGCSSLIGYIQEHGPWVIEDDATEIHENPYPWNAKANMLYLESPAGVGFSVAKETQDNSFNDMLQSQDAFKALQEWFKKFPEFQNHELFVSGESYGGIYVPYLTYQIFQYNRKVDSYIIRGKRINLQGMIVGNGATNWKYDASASYVDTFWGFSIIPKKLYEDLKSNNCTEFFRDIWPTPNKEVCEPLMDQMYTLIENLYIYDLLRKPPAGHLSSPEDRMGVAIVDGEEKIYKKGYTMSEYTPWLKNHPLFGQQDLDQIVYGDFLSDYLNNPKNRELLNIPSDVPAWNMCSDTIDYNLQNEASQWIYSILKNQGIRMLFFSGDSDGAVPTEGTRLWIEELGWKVAKKWRHWKTGNQVSGFIEQYEGGLDFVTIRGVGHMAPQWARQQAQQMFNSFIANEDL